MPAKGQFKHRTIDSLKSNCLTTLDGCWTWKRATQGHYGLISHDGKKITVHRLVYTLMHGEIPEGKFICHHCDNKRCCNPDHLFCGTNQDNMRDALSKNRLPLGHEMPNSKLTPDQVRNIRKDGRSLRKIGKDYHVDQSRIFHIKKGISYRNVV